MTAPEAPRDPGAIEAIRALAVVIPAKDEEALLPRLLTSLDAARAALARRHPEVECVSVLVLDDCRDRSADLAAGRLEAIVHLDAGNVGAARAAGVRHAASLLGTHWGARAWIAHTDADGRVPPNWLTAQVAAANAGADVVIGTVRPDRLDPRRRRAWLATRSATPNGHVHGANLGVRADLDAAVGGVAAMTEHEDVDLVQRLRGAGARIVASNEAEVVTSGRLHGRVAGGYAGYLREDLMARREGA